MKMRKQLCLLLALALLLSLVTGCASSQAGSATPQATTDPRPDVQPQLSGVGFYFDTAVTLTLMNGTQADLDALWEACKRYEALLSKTVTSSDVDRINRANGQTVTVDPETWDILRRAKEVSDASGHAFSVTIAPLTAMWDFTGGTQRMPDDETRLAALPLVNDDALVLGEGYTVTLPAGMQIDLGGIAKGYIADQAAQMVQGHVSGAILNFGGNVYVVGHKAGGAPFRVGVQDPNEANSPLAAVTVTDKSVVTSGVYERYFIKDGVRYHHILDPQTGLPATSDLVSATIVSESSMTADAYATACIVMGSERAMKMLEENGLDAILICSDGTILTTPGFKETYQFTMLK